MRTGIFGWKGEVSFHIGRPLNELIASRGETAEHYSTPEAIALLIDSEIHSHYKLYPHQLHRPFDTLEEASGASMTIVLRTKPRPSSTSRAASI